MKTKFCVGRTGNALLKPPKAFQDPRRRFCEYNADGLWQPNKNGLGMRHVFDELNKIYGKDFIRYE